MNKNWKGWDILAKMYVIAVGLAVLLAAVAISSPWVALGVMAFYLFVLSIERICDAP